MQNTLKVMEIATKTETAEKTAEHMHALVSVFAARFEQNVKAFGMTHKEAWLKAAQSIADEFDETIALAACEMFEEALLRAS